jgi:undecaprenyl-diphosphatase
VHALEWWQAVVLGLVEGITEYLPISSTGHLILASSLMGLDTPERKGAVDAFNIVIQGGAILAVLGLYWPSVRRMLMGLLGKDPKGLKLFVNLVIAFIPAAIIGPLLDDYIEAHLFHTGPVLAALVVGGIFMMLLSGYRSGRLGPPPSGVGRAPDIYDLSPGQALTIGLMQCVAMWPGTSRSMMTITGGMVAGLPARQAAEFSFLLGLPTLTAATGYKLLKNLIESSNNGTPNMFEQLGWVSCALGIAVAAVSAWVAIKWLVGFLTRHGLTLFGWYRIGLAGALLALISAGVVTIGEPPAQVESTPGTIPPIDWGQTGDGPNQPSQRP